MEKKEKKWLKPVIIIAVIVAVIIIAVVAVKNYLASRSVVLSAADIMGTVTLLKAYVIVAGIAIVLAIIVSIVVIKWKKHVKYMVRSQSLIAVILVIVVVVNMACLGPEYSLINNVFGDKGSLTEDTKSKSEALVKSIASEGIVLLKNKDNGLPIKETKKINVFGWSSTNPVYAGTGSGAIDESDCITLLEGLQDAGFELNTKISDFYTSFLATRPLIALGGGAQDWTIPEPTIKDYDDKKIFEDAKNFSDTALIVISRSGGEDADLPTSITADDTFDKGGKRFTSYADDVDPSKSALELSNREVAMVDRVTSEFKNVIVVINSANAMELGWLDKYDSIKGAVWCAGPGQKGFEALGLVLSGAVNPSGRLNDTYVYDLHSIPAFNNIGNFQYDNMKDIANADPSGMLNPSFVNYVEGIYVGYKYYETAYAEGSIDYDSAVQFPFGYGLSYTSYEQSITNMTDDGTNITLDVNVKNTGSVAGKDVVEVYYTPPYTNGGIEKSDVNLVAFEKSSEIAPGKSETVTVKFTHEDMASYDYLNNKSYVLEKGNYNISVRSDSHTVIDSKSITVDNDVIYNEAHDGARPSDGIVATNQFDFAEGNMAYLSRADHFANYGVATAAPTSYSMSDEAKNTFYCYTTYDSSKTDNASAEMPATGKKNGLKITDMAGLDYNDAKWDSLLDELSIEEMNNLIGVGGYASAKVKSIGLPALIECDGPAGLKNNYSGVKGTGFPSATMIAATWNKALAKERGRMMGIEAKEIKAVGWYGPAMNVHRTPFSGRNFEYYSEDGVLSGYMGASEVAGAKEYGLQVYMKHFALNDQETNRVGMICTWSNEQAIRELYLKPFELSTKVGGASACMTSFNYIGNQWAGSSAPLLQTVLRDEWGFKGVVVTDWFMSWSGYMSADAAVYTGGDKMLSASGDVKAYVSNTDQASSVVAMRNATHNILFSIANSSAMDDTYFKTPGWVNTFVGVDVALGIIVILLEAYMVMSFLKLKKKEEVAAE